MAKQFGSEMMHRIIKLLSWKLTSLRIQKTLVFGLEGICNSQPFFISLCFVVANFCDSTVVLSSYYFTLKLSNLVHYFGWKGGIAKYFASTLPAQCNGQSIKLWTGFNSKLSHEGHWMIRGQSLFFGPNLFHKLIVMINRRETVCHHLRGRTG